MPKVLISDKLSKQVINVFKKYKIQADFKTNLSEMELLDIIDLYDGLAIRSNTKFQRYEDARRCRHLMFADITTHWLLKCEVRGVYKAVFHS